MLGLLKRYDISDVVSFSKGKLASIGIAERRRLAKICIVDDRRFAAHDNLRECGYNIVHIGNCNDPRDVIDYDIVLCDILDVANRLNENLQGAALVKEIKRLNPEKYVIVYSSLNTRNKIMRMAIECANTRVDKSEGVDGWCEVLDVAIDQILDPVERWRLVREQLLNRNVAARTVARLEHSYAKSLLKVDQNGFQKVVRKVSISEDVRPILQGLASSAIWAAIVAA